MTIDHLLYIRVFPDEWRFVKEGLRQLSIQYKHRPCWGDGYREVGMRPTDWHRLRSHLGGLIPHYDTKRLATKVNMSQEMIDRWGDYPTAKQTQTSILRIIHRSYRRLFGWEVRPDGHVDEDRLRQEIDGGGIRGYACTCWGDSQCESEACRRDRDDFVERIKRGERVHRRREQSGWKSFRHLVEKPAE